MNSLIQSLFFTNEFRSALYDFEYSSRKGPQDRCIPYQMQKLFSNMQASPAGCAETKELTHSFGWTGAEAFVQQDVQELQRVLFDALEQTYVEYKPYEGEGDYKNRLHHYTSDKGENEHGKKVSVVTDIFGAEMEDYIECTECGHKSARTEEYLDIPLVVQGYNNVLDALDGYQNPELLCGDNQYTCGGCNKKVDAKKGMRLHSLPYILSLQMKRFDFNYQTMQRIKINTECKFPRVLDMNVYLNSEAKQFRPTEWYPTAGASSTESTSEESTDSTNTEEEEEKTMSPQELLDSLFETDYAQEQKQISQALENGQYVYQLYSVLVHSGNAMGGHYYAFIRPFETKGRWFNFNDSTVNEVAWEDVKLGSYGTSVDSNGTVNQGMGIKNNKKYHVSSVANAYMLMYRQVLPDRNCDEVTDDSMPSYLQDNIKEYMEWFEKEQQAYEARLRVLRLQVIYGDAQYNIPIDKSETLATLKQQVMDMIEFDDSVKFENTRLRAYNLYTPSHHS
eukprot:TRINITY_DN2740_c0_g1_i3.p1 TRINITY_DN2740_c0_g1~~TRINITY_DN2740_c0_g1_i3.p1  ORF type:complete len:507 (+),score=164.71 TRINITY_DN2740_c0_g1_i3:502-2022(+)